LIYDWKAIIEQDEKKTFDFFNLLNNILPVCESHTQFNAFDNYEELVFNICQVRILPCNIEELIKDAKPTV